MRPHARAGALHAARSSPTPRRVKDDGQVARLLQGLVKGALPDLHNLARRERGEGAGQKDEEGAREGTGEGRHERKSGGSRAASPLGGFEISAELKSGTIFYLQSWY